MPVNGVPSDDWKVERALGPYAKRMDEDELQQESRLIQKKRKASLRKDDQEFKMPF